MNKLISFFLAMLFATIAVGCNSDSGYSGAAPLSTATTVANSASPAGTTTPIANVTPTINSASRTAAPASETNKCPAPPTTKIASFDCAGTVKGTLAGTVSGQNFSDNNYGGGICTVSGRSCSGLDLNPSAQDCGLVSGAVNVSGQIMIEANKTLHMEQIDYAKAQAALPAGESLDHFGGRIGRCFAWQQCNNLDPNWVKSIVSYDYGNTMSLQGTACGAFLVAYQQVQ